MAKVPTLPDTESSVTQGTFKSKHGDLRLSYTRGIHKSEERIPTLLDTESSVTQGTFKSKYEDPRQPASESFDTEGNFKFEKRSPAVSGLASSVTHGTFRPRDDVPLLGISLLASILKELVSFLDQGPSYSSATLRPFFDQGPSYSAATLRPFHVPQDQCLSISPGDVFNAFIGYIVDGLEANLSTEEELRNEFLRVEGMHPSKRIIHHADGRKFRQNFISGSRELQKFLDFFNATDILAYDLNGLILVIYPDEENRGLSQRSIGGLPSNSGIIKTVNVQRTRFLMLSSDFFVAYDGINHKTLLLVPRSAPILLNGNNISLDSFLRKIPTYQVHLLSRRLYQFTKARLTYDCFAKLEKELMVKKSLIPWQFNIFDGAIIQLDPMMLTRLVGYNVNFMPIPGDYYNISVEGLGEVIVLERTKSKIANPVLLSRVDLPNDLTNAIEIIPSMTDNIDIAIGGDNHMLDPVEPERAFLRFPPNFSHSIRQSSNDTQSALNLAYIPMNKSFYEFYDKKFERRSMDRLYNICRHELKYGEHLSNAIRKCALQELFINDTQDPVGFTLVEAQNLLFREWGKMTDTNCELFSMWEGEEITNGWSLLRENGELYVVRSRRLATYTFTAGVSPFPLKIGTTISEGDYRNRTKVSSLYDAVVKVSGSQFDLERAISDKYGSWFKPKAKKMEELLGALAFVCTFLSGRVNPEGMFAGAATASTKKSAQDLDVNMPVPLGLACTTLSAKLSVTIVPHLPETLQDKMMFRPDAKLCMAKYYNYTLPLILGGDERDQALMAALLNSVSYEKELGPQHQNKRSINQVFRTTFNRVFVMNPRQETRDEQCERANSKPLNTTDNSRTKIGRIVK